MMEYHNNCRFSNLDVRDGDVWACDNVFDFGGYCVITGHEIEVVENEWFGVHKDHWNKLTGTFRLVSRANYGLVRTITRKEVVPGVYGDVNVRAAGTKYVRINIDASMYSSKLRTAAATLIEIADALGDE